MRLVEFTDYERAVIEDFESVQMLQYKSLHDELLQKLFDDASSIFMEDSFRIVYNSGSTYDVSSGRGYLTDSAPVGEEPAFKAVQLDADLTGQALTAPDGANDRIDVISVTFNKIVTDTDTRDINTGGTGPITPTLIDKKTRYTYTITVTDGTPAGSPSAPATPAGHVKLAEAYVTAVTGVANQDALTDFREAVSLKSKKKLSAQDITYVGGTSSSHFGLIINAGSIHTVNVGADLITGQLVVNGNLVNNGLTASLY